MISTPVTIALVFADLGLLAILLGGLAFGALKARRPAVLAIGGGGLVAWCVVTFVLAKQGFFESDPTTTMPPRLGVAIVIPVIVGSALVALRSVRRVIERIPLQWLVGVQFYRVAGALFLIAWLQDDIPAEFALPAGIGDVLVGLLAPFVALSIARNGADRAWPRVVAWCALGIADLAVAVTCGFLSAPSAFQQLALDNPNEAITSYPFVLIPVFAVPASIVLHVFVLARVLRRPAAAAQPRTA